MMTSLALFRHIFIFIYLISMLHYSYGSTNEYGVLAAESSTEKENFCIIYFKEFGALPTDKSKAEFDMLQDDSSIDWCDDHPSIDPSKKIELAAMGNCSVSTQALNIQDRGGKGVFFVVPSGKVGNYDVNDTDAQSVNITVGLISDSSANKLKVMGESVSVRIFTSDQSSFDYSLLLIWLIAMFTVAAGAYFSGHIRYEIHCNEMNSLPGAPRPPTGGKPHHPRVNPAEESSLNVSPYFVLLFVGLMGLMLVLLYFLYSYLVYFIIALFAVASTVAVFSCFIPLVMKIPGGSCTFNFHCCTKSFTLDFRRDLFLAFSLGISIFWVIIRKEKYSWILQDILGVIFCIHMLKSVRLPNLKICTILLCLLFVYDIFFVFITPFFTAKGESVMEEVATGGGTGGSAEMLPMVLKVSHFRFDQMGVCYQQFSILGFGDILVPGLLVSYCHAFDLISGTKKIYYITTVVAYGIGMFVAFVGLFLMSTAQPALLYLVPCTLVPPMLIAWCRGEFYNLWNGFKVVKPTDASNYPEVQVAASNPPLPEPSTEKPTLPSLDSYAPKDSAIVSEGTADKTDERNLLLR